MIEAGDLHVLVPHRLAVGLHRGNQQTEVRCIGQQIFMQRRRIGQRPVGAEPDVLDRIGGQRVVGIFLGHRAKFDRLRAQQFFAHFLGNQVRALLGDFQFRWQVFRTDHLRHFGLVLKAFFVVLERRTAREYRVALLDRRHPTRAETATVTHPVNLIHHRQPGIARAQEIAVHRMHMARLFNRLTGRRQRLTEHLTTEQLTKTQVLATATEQVFFDRLQRQQVDQIFQHLAHSDSPHTTQYRAVLAAAVDSVSGPGQHVVHCKRPCQVIHARFAAIVHG
ncbi:hypothetical protein D9M69_404740 [compost metagenome]